MKIEDFPDNDEINEIRDAILDLEITHSWGAITHAKTDLYHLLKKRQKWVMS